MARTKAELGAIGLPLFAGQLSLDTNTRLRGVRGMTIYREMATDEPACAACLNAAATLLRTDLQVTPGGSTDNDKKAAEFVEQCLNDMRDAVATYVRQMYGMLVYGYDIHEIVWKRRNGGVGSRYTDGKVGWATWALRRQASFHRWETNKKTGRVEGWSQRPAPSYDIRTIPLNKAIHIVADDSEGSPEGKSVCRGMYVQFFFVKNIQNLLGISLERGAGIPVFELQPGIPALTGDDETTLLELLAAVRQNEDAGVITPAGVKFYFAPLPGLRAEDYLNAIQRMRVWMLATFLADFIALGTEGGSYALGADKSELFLLALNGFQDRLTSALNRQAIPRLFRYNDFGKLTNLPQIALPAVRRYDLNALSNFSQILANIGAFHVTPEDEALFRKISDLPDLDIETLKKLHEQDDEEPPPPGAGVKEGDVETGKSAGDVENADEEETDENEVAVKGEPEDE